MFAAVIKNTILFSMIVVISHLMLRNKLYDLNMEAAKEERFLVASVGPAPAAIAASPDSKTVQEVDRLISIAEYDEDVIKRKRMEQLKDLYSFVYDDVSADDLQTFYDSHLKVPCVTKDNKTVRCDPLLAADSRVASTSMCANPIDQHIEKNKKLTVGAPVMTGAQFKAGMELQQYENESVMTGGKMDSLVGFDGFDLQYSQI